MEFRTLLSALKRILSLLKRETPLENSFDTQPNWKHVDLVGICVGHSRKGDNGAVNVNKESEWSFNTKVALALKKELLKRGIRSKAYTQYAGSSYSEAMSLLSNALKRDKVGLAIELHFNAYKGKSRGCSMIYAADNQEGMRLASDLQNSVLKEFETRDRGAIGLKAKGRGWLFVKNDQRPTVLCEPFFGDNKQECKLFSKPARLASSYADGIEKFLVGKN